MSVCKIVVLQDKKKNKERKICNARKLPMLLLMIYENDTHKALTNKATVSRVRHRAVKVLKIICYKFETKVYYCVIKEIGTKSFTVQLHNPPSVVG